jgi:predicted nucleic acid-binding protein
VNLYAESSSVLAWLLGEPDGEGVQSALAGAELVMASDLTLVECDRVLHRATLAGVLSEADAAARRRTLSRAAAHWILFRIDGEVIERARRPFPVEPIRTLDALHLSTALLVRSLVPNLRLLALDRRVRDNGGALGFELVPASSAVPT